MKYEEWIKYEEERLRHKAHRLTTHITVNGRELNSLTLDEMLSLMRAWVALQPPNLHPHMNEATKRSNSSGMHVV